MQFKKVDKCFLLLLVLSVCAGGTIACEKGTQTRYEETMLCFDESS